MCDAAGRITIVRQLPQLFHADAVDLRFTSFVESQALDKLFRQRPAWSFSQYSDLRTQIHSRLVVRFGLPSLSTCRQCARRALDRSRRKEDLRRKLRKDVDADLFTLLAQPRSQTIQRNDVVTVVLQGGGVIGERNASFASGKENDLL